MLLTAPMPPIPGAAAVVEVMVVLGVLAVLGALHLSMAPVGEVVLWEMSMVIQEGVDLEEVEEAVLVAVAV